MKENEAKIIGSKQGLICAGLGIVIAQSIMTAMFSSDLNLVNAFLWFTRVNYKLNLFLGVIILLLCGHFYGQLAGKAILIKKQNYILVGFLVSIAVLLTTAFLSSWTGFFQEGIENIGTNDDPFEDYIFNPLYWVTIFGIVPAFIVGLWFGRQIKVKGKKFDINQMPKNVTE